MVGDMFQMCVMQNLLIVKVASTNKLSMNLISNELSGAHIYEGIASPAGTVPTYTRIQRALVVQGTMQVFFQSILEYAYNEDVA